MWYVQSGLDWDLGHMSSSIFFIKVYVVIIRNFSIFFLYTFSELFNSCNQLEFTYCSVMLEIRNIKILMRNESQFNFALNL